MSAIAAQPTTNSEAIVEATISAIQDRKGFDITVLDMRKLENPAMDYFIICSGNSDRQTEAIAENVLRHLRDELSERPISKEGRETGEWILLDYVNVVVHIFLPRVREYYDLTGLWGDAGFRRIPDVK